MDFEYYVPTENRRQNGLSYNPNKPGNLLLGGVFYTANPTKDLKAEVDAKNRKYKRYFIWNYKGERELSQAIHNHLSVAVKEMDKHFEGSKSIVLCGIGITNSDFLVLFELFRKHKLGKPEDLFYLQNSLRVVDLSQLGLATFKHSSSYLYPMSKGDLLMKYFPEIKIGSGKEVWALYESNRKEAIEMRVEQEVSISIDLYIAIKANLDHFKELEANEKRAAKLQQKMQGLQQDKID